MTNKIDISVITVRRLLVRLVAAFGLSAGCLFVLILLFRAQPALDGFALFSLPVSVLAGLLPLIYWYRRDAYPIGLIYSPATFYALREAATRILY